MNKTLKIFYNRILDNLKLKRKARLWIKIKERVNLERLLINKSNKKRSITNKSNTVSNNYKRF